MTESNKTDDISEILMNILRQKNYSLWKDCDDWIAEHPLQRRQKFLKIQPELILCGNQTRAIVGRITGNRVGKTITENSMEEFACFMRNACETSLIKGNDDKNDWTVFTFLSEIFSIKLYPMENGPILDYLKVHLSTFLSHDMAWKSLVFETFKFRKIYFQLLDVFNLRDRYDSVQSPMEKKMKPMLLFSCLVLAVLLAIWNENELCLLTQLNDYKDCKKVEDFFSVVIDSEHFRTLSFFFLVGFFVLIKHRENGGCVTDNKSRPTSQEKLEKMKKEFAQRIADIPEFKKGFHFPLKNDEPDRIRKLTELFSVDLISKGLLRDSDSVVQESPAPHVNKGGRPRKVQNNNKRKVESPVEVITPRKMFKGLEKSPTKKKDQRKISKQLKDTTRDDEEENDLSDSPGPSVVPIPDTPPAPPAPVREIIVPADVGMCPPIFVLQMNVVKQFRDEVERRKTVGNCVGDSERVRRQLTAHYKELERVAGLISRAPKPKLTPNQLRVHSNYKSTWRQIEPEPCYAQSDHNSKIEQKEKDKTVSKLSKKFKKM